MVGVMPLGAHAGPCCSHVCILWLDWPSKSLVAAAGLGQPRAQPGVATQLGGRREPTDVAHLGGDVEPSTQAIPGAVIPSDPATV
jgi:hypothetical protein